MGIMYNNHKYDTIYMNDITSRGTQVMNEASW
jgi:hypothetical protein